MSWVNDEISLDLVVENKRETQETIAVGCRTEDEVIFTEQKSFSPMETARWDDLPQEEFEIGINVRDGPTEGVAVDSTDGLSEIIAIVTGDEIKIGGSETASESTPSPDGKTHSPQPAGSEPPQSSQSTQSTTSSQKPTKAPDEIFCRSCGDPIKQHAEVCPECGVRNKAYDPTAGSPSTNATNATPNQQSAPPAQAQTQQSRTSQAQSSGSPPSSRWGTGVKIGALLWVIVLLLLVPAVLAYQRSLAGAGIRTETAIQSLGLAALLPPTQILAWIVLAVSMYFDLKYIGYYVDDWPLRGWLYIAGTVILPLFTQVLGAVALFSGGVAPILAGIVPVIILLMTIRHLRTRSRVLSEIDT